MNSLTAIKRLLTLCSDAWGAPFVMDAYGAISSDNELGES